MPSSADRPADAASPKDNENSTDEVGTNEDRAGRDRAAAAGPKDGRDRTNGGGSGRDRADAADPPDPPGSATSPGHPEHDPHAGLGSRLNRLRAGVLGANDGIVSTAGLVVGVAGATSSRDTLLASGIAGLLAGSLSMASGEYVSVSTQRDTEQAALELEKRELTETPDAELAELAGLYRDMGLSAGLAQQVAEELTAHDALAAHASTELGIDPEELVKPWDAAFASFVSFSLGALLPLLTIVLPPEGWRVPATVVSVLIALAVTGWVSARLGGAGPLRAVTRNVLGGAIAMGITYLVGTFIGTATG